MSDIVELTNKYIVIPTKYLRKPNTIEYDDRIKILFKGNSELVQYNYNKTKYFVMKLDDMFDIDDIIMRLQRHYRKNYDKTLETRIKGSDLALIILNSITDKSKLNIKNDT